MPSTIGPHPELAPKAHVEGRTIDLLHPMPKPLLLCLALLAACAPASDYRPTVELGGLDSARYETDLRDCKKVAERDRYAPVVVGVLQGAVIGVALGSAIAAIGGGNVGLAQSYGAISGTMAGGAVAGSQVREPPDETAVVDQCLRNNGYQPGYHR
jgi:outer membrane lipoprotein SlyB